MEKFEFTAEISDDKKRFDQFLKARLPDYSRAQLQKWIKAGDARRNGQKLQPSFLLKAGDRVTLTVPEEETRAVPENIPLDVLYEDDAILVINKPAGMLAHPAAGHYGGTVANAAAWHLRKKTVPKKKAADSGGSFRPGIVHRLDRDTSGVMVLAKKTTYLEKLSLQFREREVKKVYRAVVCGRMQAKRGEIEGAIGVDLKNRRMAVLSSGRSSRTDFKVLKTFPGHTYLEAYPRTGRTHQIRVHLQKIGHPVAGDYLYGENSGLSGRHLLHAYSLTFRHPKTGKDVSFTAPLPRDFADVLKKLEKKP